MTNLISQETLLNEINHLYNLNYGEQLIDPQAFYEMVECQEVIKKQKPRADREIRVLAKLLEAKTELQEQALSRTGASKRMCLAQVKGIDKALEIVKKEIGEDICPECQEG